MSKPVIFRRGNLADFGVPVDEFIGSDDQSIFFVEDENTLYKSVGAGKKLVRFSDVQSGFADRDDLISKVNTGIEGKLYLTENNKIYYYLNGEWKTITAEAELDSIGADKVEIDLSNTSLTSDNVLDAIIELDGKVSTNKNGLTSVKGRVTTLENKLVDVGSWKTFDF